MFGGSNLGNTGSVQASEESARTGVPQASMSLLPPLAVVVFKPE